MTGSRKTEGMGTEKGRSHQQEREVKLKVDFAVHAAIPGWCDLFYLASRHGTRNRFQRITGIKHFKFKEPLAKQSKTHSRRKNTWTENLVGEQNCLVIVGR